MDADNALLLVSELADHDHTDAVADEFERLLPTLIEAGYVEADDYTWRLTPEGVARAELLTGEDEQGNS